MVEAVKPRLCLAVIAVSVIDRVAPHRLLNFFLQGFGLQFRHRLNIPMPVFHCPRRECDLKGFLTNKDAFGEDVWIQSDERSANRCIRVNAVCLSKELAHIQSCQDVWHRIETTKSLQSTFANSELYPRCWSDSKCSPCVATFTVAQFNMLAEGLASGPETQTPFDFDHTHFSGTYGDFTAVANPDVALDFQYRRWRLLEVLLQPHGTDGFDIIVSEEIDRYGSFFAPILELFGYSSIFVPKPRAPGIQMGWYSDGCAIFWKRNRFSVIESGGHEFSQGKQGFAHAILQETETGKQLAVVATHLKAKQGTKNTALRQLQANELVEFVSGMKREVDRGSLPVILAGDFNEEVGEGSSVEHVLRSKDKFSSAYDLGDATLYSTCKIRHENYHQRLIDYIFHTKRLECIATLAVPKLIDLEEGKLPGVRYPSDHVLIAAKFGLSDP